MNKDVIYIEPEDDITDIITKIENSKEKIIALVPPKKAGVMRSVVNMKLIHKAGVSAEKKIVLVTTDPSIIKLAATVKLPVTKDLQSAPTIPQTEEEIEEEEVTAEVVEEIAEEEVDEEIAEVEEEVDEEVVEEIAEEEEEKKDKKAKKKKDGKFLANTKNPFLIWVRDHTKLVSALAIGVVAVILIGIWAFVIAPAATITVSVRTTKNNFSENVTFTKTLTDEDSATGKFYLTEYKTEEKSEVEFEATGKKNVGEKATGSVVVYAYFKNKGSVAINSGSTFTIGGLSFVSTENTSLSWDGSTDDACDNKGNLSAIINSGCQVSGRVSVVATGSGTNYNIAPSSTGWSTTAKVGVYSDKEMAGGTDKTVTVVLQSDIDKALAEMKVATEAENKTKLLETIPEGAFVIDASFRQVVGDGVSTPAVGEEVKEGEKAKLTVTTTDTIFAVDKTKVEEFISEKAKLADGFKIYEINDPFVENFIEIEGGYTGKLKTSFIAGPKVTENDIVEIVRGKGFGTAQHELKSINGVGEIRIEGSFPWVTSVPNDPEKITINLETKE